MKSKYLNADDLCLKYVLNELDPSEVIVVEKMMTEDENVLIDIESMRRTLSRIDNMPRISPPLHVQQSILKQAAEFARNGNGSVPLFSLQNRMFSWAAAAVVVLGLGLVSYNISFAPGSDGAEATGQSEVATQSEAETSVEGINPWVDRSEILRLTGPAADGADEDGLQNLRPVENTTQPISPFREVQLTRVQRN